MVKQSSASARFSKCLGGWQLSFPPPTRASWDEGLVFRLERMLGRRALLAPCLNGRWVADNVTTTTSCPFTSRKARHLSQVVRQHPRTARHSALGWASVSDCDSATDRPDPVFTCGYLGCDLRKVLAWREAGEKMAPNLAPLCDVICRNRRHCENPSVFIGSRLHHQVMSCSNNWSATGL